MAFALRKRKTPKTEINQRISRIAELLDIKHLLPLRPGTLSGGQLQSAALAKALVRNADILLLDEPLSNLDAQRRNRYREVLKQLHHKQGMTVVYVTHNQEEVMMLADNICVLNRGRVQQVGSPDDIHNKPANDFVTGFFGG
jgi:ABC-type sugar transport system ATPase subunit